MAKILLFLGLTLYLWAVPASSAEAVTMLVTTVAGWLGLGTLGTAILGIVVYGALYYFASKSMKDQQKGQGRSIMVNKNSNNDPIPVIYGRRRTGGVRAYVESSNGAGDTAGTQYLNMVISLCEGEMGSIRQVYFGDDLAWDIDDGGSVSGSRTGGYTLSGLKAPYDALASLRYHPGHPDQTVDTMIQNSVGSANWSNNHRLRGIAYIAVKLKADNDNWKSGVPTTTCVIDGKRIKNVESGSIYASADQHPVDVIYDYLTNPIYGKGLTESDLFMGTGTEYGSFTYARNVIGNAIPFNGPAYTDKQLFENINQMAESANLYLIYSAGYYRLIPNRANEVASRVLGDDEIIGEISVVGNNKSVRKNRFSVTFNNPDIKYNEDMVIVDSSAYLAEDNGTVLEAKIGMELITDKNLVETLAQYKMDMSRKNMMLSLTVPHTWLTAECGDVIAVTNADFGFDGKLFRIMKLEITTDNTVDLLLTEYISSIQII